MSSLESSIGEVFRKMGLPDPGLMSQLGDEWEELAGTPWAGRSRPVVVKGNSLVVEASTASMVAFLRYGVPDLLGRLRERFGSGVIEEIEVVPPGRR